jgi:hypothetical protein
MHMFVLWKSEIVLDKLKGFPQSWVRCSLITVEKSLRRFGGSNLQ